MNTATLPSAVERLDLENTGDRAQVFMHKQRYDLPLKVYRPRIQHWKSAREQDFSVKSSPNIVSPIQGWK